MVICQTNSSYTHTQPENKLTKLMMELGVVERTFSRNFTSGQAINELCDLGQVNSPLWALVSSTVNCEHRAIFKVSKYFQILIIYDFMCPALYQEFFLAIRKQKRRNNHVIQEAIKNSKWSFIPIIKGQEVWNLLRPSGSSEEGVLNR